MKFASAFLMVLVVALLLGCAPGDGSVSKQDDETIRKNASRALTPEEQAKMGSGAPTATKADTKGLESPEKKPVAGK